MAWTKQRGDGVKFKFGFILQRTSVHKYLSQNKIHNPKMLSKEFSTTRSDKCLVAGRKRSDRRGQKLERGTRNNRQDG